MKKLPEQDSLTKSMSELTQDKINETAPKAEEMEPQVKMTAKEMAAKLGLRYIEPVRKLKAIGKLPAFLEKEHAYMWEYVKGMYENYDFIGETLSFFLCLYPGDPDCMWSIPANVPVYVPRMVAKHLEECQKYHTFAYKDKRPDQKEALDFNEEFCVDKTHYRGKFRPIEAFA